MRKRHVWNRLYFGYLENPKIGLPLVESIERIMIRAEIFGRLCQQIARWNIRHNATPSTMPLWTPKPIMRRVNWSITTRTQWFRNVADSHRNKSQLHKLSFV